MIQQTTVGFLDVSNSNVIYTHLKVFNSYHIIIKTHINFGPQLILRSCITRRIIIFKSFPVHLQNKLFVLNLKFSLFKPWWCDGQVNLQCGD